MTDFFTRLAERTFGLALSAQPIIAPLFASETPQVEADSCAAVLTGEPGIPALKKTSSSEENTIASDEKHALRTSAYDKNLPAAMPIPSARIRDEVLRHTEVEHLPVLNTVSVPSVTTTQKNEGLDSSLPHEHVATNKKEHGSNSGDIDLFRQQRRQEDIPVSMQTPESQIVVAQAPQPRSALTKSVQPQMLLVSEKKAPPMVAIPISHAEVLSAMPIVHVTIGRIEVRAIPPPASTVETQRQRSATSAMSLEDYLKQQAKGGHP